MASLVYAPPTLAQAQCTIKASGSSCRGESELEKGHRLLTMHQQRQGASCDELVFARNEQGHGLKRRAAQNPSRGRWIALESPMKTSECWARTWCRRDESVGQVALTTGLMPLGLPGGFPGTSGCASNMLHCEGDGGAAQSAPRVRGGSTTACAHAREIKRHVEGRVKHTLQTCLPGVSSVLC